MSLLIGQEQAEKLKIDLGTAVAGIERISSSDAAGRDLRTGLLRRARFDANQIRVALERPLA